MSEGCFNKSRNQLGTLKPASKVGFILGTVTLPRLTELGNTTFAAAYVEKANEAFAKVRPATGVQSFMPPEISTPCALNVALIDNVVPRMSEAPAIVADIAPFAYCNESEGALITTPLVTVISGNVAVNVDVVLVNVPVKVAGPWKPAPTSTETFPVAVKANAQGDPTVQVALMLAPASAIFTPGNGSQSEEFLNDAANVLVLPLRAIEPVIPAIGNDKPGNGVHVGLFPVLNAMLNEY
ncbi:unannotated protein [freshwater metagenome]|uniref:Unannotated protein n=1 Tax=freshwater metagenome TaxID=449393 RepID=A0A6J7RJX9_9ZZZZ